MQLTIYIASCVYCYCDRKLGTKFSLAGYHAIAHKHDVPDEDVMATTASGAPEDKAFDMPELLHNLDLLVDMSEDAIIQNDKRLRYETDNIVNIKVRD